MLAWIMRQSSSVVPSSSPLTRRLPKKVVAGVGRRLARAEHPEPTAQCERPLGRPYRTSPGIPPVVAFLYREPLHSPG